jgi:hypothetical protein
MAELMKSERVDSPSGTRVQVLFYDDDSIRFRIYESPLVLEEAFLTGNRQDHAIIKVTPRRALVDSADQRRTDGSDPELTTAKGLLEEFLVRFQWVKDHPDYFSEVEQFLGK